MTQSSRLVRALPACAAAVWTLGYAAALSAQQRVRLPQAADARSDADINSAAATTVAPGTEVTLGATRGRLVQGTFEGYIWAGSVRRVGRTQRLTVSATNGENLRVEPNVRVVAHLPAGFTLEQIARQGGWFNVRATAWFEATTLTVSAPAAAPAGRPNVGAPPRQRVPDVSSDTQAAAGAPDSGGVNLDRALVARAATLRRVPDGPMTGNLAADAPVKVLARSGEWVRVQTEGWVRASELRPGTGVMAGVSGAEIRTRPQDFEGRLLQWSLQFIAIQTADELRRDIPAGRRYVLARGPLPEAGFVYLLVSEAQLREFAQLAPLAQIVVVGRVRVARSQYLGNPILDLVDLRAMQP
jgi:hypothetical protein